MQRDLAVIWAIHFACKPPVQKLFHELIGEDRLLQAARATRVWHILCGHLHEPREYVPAGYEGLRIYMADTAVQPRNRRGGTLGVYEIDVDGGTVVSPIRTRRSQWDSTEGEYLEAQS